MFRVLLTMVLTMLVALPHGICFCPHASASESVAASCCHPIDDAEAPAAPTDDDDDHDQHNCSCKLIETLARDADPVAVEHDLNVSFTNPTPILDVSPVVNEVALASTDASSRPLPLILCALRI